MLKLFFLVLTCMGSNPNATAPYRVVDRFETLAEARIEEWVAYKSDTTCDGKIFKYNTFTQEMELLQDGQ